MDGKHDYRQIITSGLFGVIYRQKRAGPPRYLPNVLIPRE